jgi:hypothetical protein
MCPPEEEKLFGLLLLLGLHRSLLLIFALSELLLLPLPLLLELWLLLLLSHVLLLPLVVVVVVVMLVQDRDSVLRVFDHHDAFNHALLHSHERAPADGERGMMVCIKKEEEGLMADDAGLTSYSFRCCMSCLLCVG